MHMIQTELHLQAKIGVVILSSLFAVRMLHRMLDPVDPVAIRAQALLCKRLRIPVSALSLNQNEVAMAANVVAPDELDVDLCDVAGCDAIIDSMKRDVLFQMQHPALAKIDLMVSATGILLYGPPGTGKTMLAKVSYLFHAPHSASQ